MKYAYWLSNVNGMTPVKIRSLLSCMQSAKEVYGTSEQVLKKTEGISPELVENIQKSKKEWNLDEKWYDLMAKGIGMVSMEQENYPKRLRNIHNPPYVLYYIGDLPNEEQKSVAIVGSRGRSAYGSQAAHLLAKRLSDYGVLVISGLARGIDGDAHKGALEGSSPTYAILGCGVDICYPREHYYLYEEITTRGGILSEYPPGTPPKPIHFPQRNRIIAGLSDCVAVMEAREKSGSLITADYAMEQGKDVYALPGRITDPLSAGCNHLIKQGAGIVQSVEDFLKDLDIMPEKNYMQENFIKKLLEKDETLVYSLTDFQPISLGTLMEKTNLSLCQLLEAVSCLKELGLIKETVPNHYVRIM
uniref:DNA-processing protein DprA n=1 Tax=Agathobacter sp. TaxID=2021311 RepID=UPI004055ADC4